MVAAGSVEVLVTARPPWVVSPGRRPPWGPALVPPPGVAAAAPPRLMTARHPRATGSYWPQLRDWAAGRRLHVRRSEGSRWWQRLALSRALEHDRQGRLVWSTVIISTSRQQGKSWIERETCSWRMNSADLFGEEQAILHVAHKLIAAKEVWRPAARYYEGQGHDVALVRYANDQAQIELADGSRWMLQAATEGAGVAFALNMALIDEGWRVARSVYEAGIGPTLAEASSPQTWLVSTAGTHESDLMATYRAAAIAQLEDPADTLILEWSAPPDPALDIDDPYVWRAAQAHWDERRLAAIAKARRDNDERTWRQQYLNQWVPSLTPPVLGLETWPKVATSADPSGPLAFGGEVLPDRSTAVIVAIGGGVAELVDELSPAEGLAARLAELRGRHGGTIALDASGPAAAAYEDLRGNTRGRPAWLVKLTPGLVAAAALQTFDALTVDPPALRLRDHPTLQAAVSTARKRRQGQSWAWDRDRAGMIMAALSAAWWAADHSVEPEPEPEEPAVFV